MRLITLITLTTATAMVLVGCTEKSSSTPAPAPAPATTPAPSASTPAPAPASTPAPAPAAESAPTPGAAQPAPTESPAPASAPAAPPVVITPARMEMGRKAYKVGACAMCHGQDAKGSAGGPSLATGVWVHGDGSVASILAVIEKGVPKSEIKNASYPMAMPPAAMYLPSADDRLALAEYIWSLSHPAQN